MNKKYYSLQLLRSDSHVKPEAAVHRCHCICQFLTFSCKLESFACKADDVSRLWELDLITLLQKRASALAIANLAARKMCHNSFSGKLGSVQVEHGITEMISGYDLVNWQLQLQVKGLQVTLLLCTPLMGNNLTTCLAHLCLAQDSLLRILRCHLCRTQSCLASSPL